MMGLDREVGAGKRMFILTVSKNGVREGGR